MATWPKIYREESSGNLQVREPDYELVWVTCRHWSLKMAPGSTAWWRTLSWIGRIRAFAPRPLLSEEANPHKTVVGPNEKKNITRIIIVLYRQEFLLTRTPSWAIADKNWAEARFILYTLMRNTKQIWRHETFAVNLKLECAQLFSNSQRYYNLPRLHKLASHSHSREVWTGLIFAHNLQLLQKNTYGNIGATA